MNKITQEVGYSLDQVSGKQPIEVAVSISAQIIERLHEKEVTAGNSSKDSEKPATAFHKEKDTTSDT